MIVSAGQKWAQLEKEYIHYDWTSDAKIWMTEGKGGDLFACFFFLFFLHKVINC